jgi:energy-coupling factor transporter ATP-binding protein EcfA2
LDSIAVDEAHCTIPARRGYATFEGGMLKSLYVENLTVFGKARIEFSSQLNVIVGENGVGKSHLLKVPYAVLAASAEEGGKPNAGPPTRLGLYPKLSAKLVGVLRPEEVGRLVRRTTKATRCKIQCRFDDPKLDLDFSFKTTSQFVSVGGFPPKWVDKAPVFIPTRELLTIYPGFVSVYENHYLEFEESWRDTCLLLGAPLVRGPREVRVHESLKPLEEAMGGKIELDKNGRFYLNIPERGRMEMPLVAEGHRKLAMIARLIATGSLLDKGYLFWDEPETNLNPKLIKQVARTILHLCQNGIQVFVATHSLFLLRELDILLRSPDLQRNKARFIGLQAGDDGVEVEQGDTIDDIGAITALDEELSQSDRYLATERLADAQAR